MEPKDPLELTCPECGSGWALDADDRRKPQFTCPDCKTKFDAKAVYSEQIDAFVAKLEERYREDYCTAETLRLAGRWVKFAGFCITGTMLVSAAALSNNGPRFTALLVIGAVVNCLWFFVIGTLVTAAGQFQKIAVDTAVNTSPLLRNSDRIRMIGDELEAESDRRNR